jgi:hypothetical protein
MNIEKEHNRISQGITSSSEKKKVLFFRLSEFELKLKKYWYSNLLNKLEDIKNGNTSIDSYIDNIKGKLNQ